MTLADLTVEQAALFFLAFARIATMVSLLPILRGAMVPSMVKAGLALLITFIIFPVIPKDTVNLPLELIPFAGLVVKEVLVGLVLGFASGVLFVPIQFAGRLMDLQTGFAAAETMDPSTDVETTLMAQLMILVVTMLFLMMDGHHFFLRAVGDTFTVIPLAKATFIQVGGITSQISTLIGATFALAIKISAPVLAPLLITYFCLGIIARAMPQLNIFFIGLPLQIALGLLTLVLFLPAMWNLFEKYFVGFQEDFYTLFYLMR